jgi:hypothetical protein
VTRRLSYVLNQKSCKSVEINGSSEWARRREVESKKRKMREKKEKETYLERELNFKMNETIEKEWKWEKRGDFSTFSWKIRLFREKYEIFVKNTTFSQQ